MTTQGGPTRRHPALWVPTLYFAEGLPYFAVALMAALMYKSRGIANGDIVWYTSLLGWVWVVKPLWSPFLETFRSKKAIVVTFQVAGGVSLGLVALALPMPAYFPFTLALLGCAALCSATHDIAADGLYIASLSSGEQAAFAGMQGAFYNVARFFAQGALVILAGRLEIRSGVTTAWGVIFGVAGAIMVALGLYHAAVLPGSAETPNAPRFEDVRRRLTDVLVSFVRKPNVLMLIAFIILFRAGEGQVTKIGPLFLRDARAVGGLGLSTDDVGVVYGTAATLAFVGGSILGGLLTAGLGLRRALFWLICAMNLPNLAYVFLSGAQPTSHAVIASALCVEMFGYGFGFVGLILFMMQEVAPGKYQTAHYSLATGFMQLGYVLFGMVSGWFQGHLGYQRFFVWVLLSAVPALVLSRIIPFRSPAGDATGPAAEAAAS